MSTNKIAFIPARAGSKSIPDKNILLLNRRTLLERAIETAITSEQFDDVFVSTDSAEYAEIAKVAGANVPFLRPEELSGDTIKTVDVVLDFLRRMELSDSSIYLFLLQVTSPFRTTWHIKQSVEILRSANFGCSFMSVKDVDGSHPYRMQIKDSNGFLVNYENFIEQNFLPRQNLPKVYIRNGSIYANSVTDICTNKRLIREASLGMEMDAIDSINIDSLEDYLLAQTIVDKGLRA